MDLMKRLAKARTSLILEHPFIGTIALNMPMTLTDGSDGVHTAATNGKWVRFNEKFIEPLSDDELKFLVAHEIMHPVFEHMYRLMGRNHQKWNRAGDYVINQILTDEKIGKMIKGSLLNTALYNAGKGFTDAIYNILPDEPGDSAGNGYGSGDLREPDGSPAEQAQAQAEAKVMVAQAAQAAKMMGKLSVNMARIVGDILQPKVNWREVLATFVEKRKTDERNWARPNRRFIPFGIYLPTKSGEEMGELAFAIDCSGSIGERELNEFATEIKAVKERCNPAMMHIMYFDSEVCHYDKFSRDDDVVIAPHGGGGTAFSSIFRYMKTHGINPVATIVLTDLCCSDFGPAPDYPVLWVANMEGKAPWGEIVRM